MDQLSQVWKRCSISHGCRWCHAITISCISSRAQSCVFRELRAYKYDRRIRHPWSGSLHRLFQLLHKRIWSRGRVSQIVIRFWRSCAREQSTLLDGTFRASYDQATKGSRSRRERGNERDGLSIYSFRLRSQRIRVGLLRSTTQHWFRRRLRRAKFLR